VQASPGRSSVEVRMPATVPEAALWDIKIEVGDAVNTVPTRHPMSRVAASALLPSPVGQWQGVVTSPEPSWCSAGP
jgi:hypothetical protein